MQIKDIGKQVRHNLGKAIRKRRVGSQIAQKNLCKEVGISNTYLSLLENGKRFPSYETLEKIAHSLSVEPSQLLIEADLPKNDDAFELVCLLSKIIESGDKKRIKHTLDFAKSND